MRAEARHLVCRQPVRAAVGNGQRLFFDGRALALPESEIDDLVAFMASLTSKAYEALAARELARQRELSRTSRPQRDTARAFGPMPPRPEPPAP